MADAVDLDSILFFQFKENAPAATGGGTETYAYDGDGQRVLKSGPGGTTAYVYDALGRVAAEYSNTVPSVACTTCYCRRRHEKEVLARQAF